MGKVPLQASDVWRRWRRSVVLATRGDREHGTQTEAVDLPIKLLTL